MQNIHRIFCLLIDPYSIPCTYSGNFVLFEFINVRLRLGAEIWTKRLLDLLQYYNHWEGGRTPFMPELPWPLYILRIMDIGENEQK